MSNAASANADLVLSSKNRKTNLRNWGQRREVNRNKKTSPCGNRCHFSENINFLFAGAPPIENKIEQKVQTLRWRVTKVAFDTVRGRTSSHGIGVQIWAS